MFLFKLALVSFLALFGQIETHWIGEEYWTIIDWNGAIPDGRSVDDFLEIPGPDGGTTPNGWVAYWITRTTYPEIHYEAFGHAIKRDDGRICGYFVGNDEEVVEVCGGFRILSRHRTDRADAKVFQWVLAGHVTNRDETVGFVLHRIASTRYGEQIIYGDAMLLDRYFKGVRPAVFDDSIIKIGVHDFPSKVYLLVKLTPEVGPVRTGHYEGHYHDPHTDHKVHGRNGHPLPHRPRAVEARSVICPPGWYGRECLDKCSDGCEFPENCDYTSGYCSRCKRGWYGSGCSLRCYEGCESCDQNTGHCLSCRFGYHGRNCSTRCPDNCDACDQSSGYCLRCKYGWYGRDCSGRCPTECETCDQASGHCISSRARPPPSQPQAPLPKGCHRVITKDHREFVSCYPYHRSSNNTDDNVRPRVESSDKRLQDPRSNPASRLYDPIFDPRSPLYDPRYNPFDPQYDVEKDREWRAANEPAGDQVDRS